MPPRRTLHLPETNAINALLADVMAPAPAELAPLATEVVSYVGDLSDWDFDNPQPAPRVVVPAPAPLVLPPAKHSITPPRIGLDSWSVQQLVTTMNWRNDPSQARALLHANQDEPPRWSSLSLVGFLGLINWTNDPKRLHTNPPRLPSDDDVPSDGRRPGVERSLSSVMATFVWE